ANLADNLQSMQLGHVQVDNGELGCERFDHLDRRQAVSTLPHDVQLGPRLAECGQALAYYGMIVRQDDGDGLSLGHRFSVMGMVISILVPPAVLARRNWPFNARISSRMARRPMPRIAGVSSPCKTSCTSKPLPLSWSTRWMRSLC